MTMRSITPEEEFNPPDSPIFDLQNDPYGPEGYLSLDIDFFTKFAERSDSRLLSKPIVVRGIPWRILALCSEKVGKNNRSSRGQTLGFFLQCNNEEVLPKKGMWRCNGTASLEMLAADEKDNVTKKIHHAFHNNEVDWGFTNFETFENILQSSAKYCINDTVKLRVRFNADVPTGAGFYWDSKSHTGFIGLRNQGATCYMNSILQAFYFTTGFRKAVYQMEIGAEPTDTNICLAMQRVFYELQMSSEAVETNSLTRAFGWDKLDAFNQHDVQEFCRVLLDNLETKMKGSKQENSIPSLFRGKMKSYISCTEVDYESSRTETFYDVQLNVLGLDTLERAFEAYTATEVLEGDNKYDAGNFGLQTAEKGVKFVQLPPFLHVQLMRFQYCGVEQKVNEKFSFPEHINLESSCHFNDELTKEDCLYTLHAVLVHSGEFHGGHYVTFINTNVHEKYLDPTIKPKWCKFDDDVVSRTTLDDAISSNFGGEKSVNSSAYMLIYVRDNAIGEYLAPIPDSEIPESVSRTFEMERLQKNRLKKKKEEEQMCIEIPIVTPEAVTGHHGFDLVDICSDSIKSELINRSLTSYQLYEFMERRLFSAQTVHDQSMDVDDIPINAAESYRAKKERRETKTKRFNFRLWIMQENFSNDRDGNRLVSRYRPSRCINPFQNDLVDRLFHSDSDSIYVEYPNQDGQLPYYDYSDFQKIPEHMLVFIKFYDSTNNVIINAGSLILEQRFPLDHYRETICKKAGIAPETLIRYHEEVAPNQIVAIDDPRTGDLETVLHDDDGAIIVIEPADCIDSERNVAAKYADMYKTIFVEFIEFRYNKKQELMNETISKKVKTDQKLSEIAEQLGEELAVDPKNILLWTKPANTRPEACLDDYSTIDCRAFIGRAAHDPRNNKKYRVNYAIMPFPVNEMNSRSNMKIFSMNEKKETEEMIIFPPREGTVADILVEAARSFKFAKNGSGKLRLLQIGASPVFNSRVYQIWAENVPVHDIESKILYKQSQCRVEEIPVDELELQPGELLCPVVHFDKEPAHKLFGVAFVIKIRNGELMTDVRDRLKRHLPDVSEADFNKFKFALLSRDKLFQVCRFITFGEHEKVSLHDMANQTTGTAYPGPQVYIGIDHKSPTHHSSENAIKIHN